MADASLQYKADFSDYNQRVAEAGQSTDKLTNSLLSLITATEKINASQRQLGENQKSASDAFVSASDDQVRALGKQAQEQQTIGQKIVADQAEITRQIRATQTQRLSDLNDVNAQIRQLEQKRLTEKLTPEEKGELAELKLIAKEIQQNISLYARLEAQIRQIGREAEQQAKAFAELNRVAESTLLSRGLLAGVNRNNLDNTQIATILSQVSALQKLAQQTGLTEERILQMFNAIKSGQKDLGNLTTAEQQAEAALRRYVGTIERFNAAAQSASAAAQNIGGSLLERLGGINSNTTPAQLRSISSAVDQINKAAANLKPEQVETFFARFLAGQRTLAGVTAEERKLERALLALIIAFERAGAAGENAGRGVLLSWQSIARFGILHLLYGQVTRLIGAMQQSITVSSELSIKIAEIQTISSRLNDSIFEVDKSTQQWTQDLRILSDEFALDILDTARGAYQALSNQVTDAANSTQFLTDSAEFAILTVSNLTDSVELITSVLNSYNLGLESTTRVQNALFKTIELGRTRASELSGSFGSLTILAGQLNISIEEVGAVLANLTRQGVKTDNALTFLRNLFLRLIAPTKEMKGLLREWNVESGKAAIAQYGLAGVLAKVGEELRSVEDDAGRNVELFGRIRAIIPAAALTGENALAELQADLEKFGNTPESISRNFDELKKKLDLVFNSEGFKLKKEVNEIKNAVEAAFGDEALKRINKFTEDFGGLSGVVEGTLKVVVTAGDAVLNLVKPLGLGIKATSDLTDETVGFNNIIGTLIPGLFGYLAAVKLVTVAQNLYAAATLRAVTAEGIQSNSIANLIGRLGGLRTAIGLVVAGYLILRQKGADAQQEIDEASSKSIARITAANEKRIHDAQITAAKELQIFTVLEDQKARLVAQQLNARETISRQSLDSQLTFDNSIIKDLDVNLNVNFANLIPKEQLDFSDVLDKSIDALKESIGNVRDLNQELQDLNPKSLTDLETLFNQLSSKVNLTDFLSDIEKGRDRFDQILKVAKDLSSLRIKSIEKMEESLKKSLDLTDRLTKTFDQQLFEFKIEGLSDKGQIDAISERIKKLIAESKQFELAGNAEKAREALDEAVDLSKKIISINQNGNKDLEKFGIKSKVDTKQFEDVAKQRLDLEARIQDQLKKDKAAEQAQLDLQKQTTQKLIETQIDLESQLQQKIQSRIVDLAEENKLYREQKQAIQEINALLASQKERKQQLEEKLSKDKAELQTIQKSIAGESSTLQALINKGADTIFSRKDIANLKQGAFKDVFNEKQQADFEEFIRLQQELQKALTDTNTPEVAKIERLQEIIPKAQAAIQSIKQGVIDSGVDLSDIFSVDNVIKFNKVAEFFEEAAKKLAEAQKAVASDQSQIAALEREIAARDQLLKQHQINLKAIQAQTQASVAGAQNVNAELDKQLNLLKQIEAAQNRIANQRANSAPGNLGDLINVGGHAGGGEIYGKPGFDANITKVSDGEFISNASASTKFRPQLVAMNLGFKPQDYGPRSGDQNFNFGDVIVNHQGGSSVEADVREIGYKLRREIKRGNFSWD